jgi:hypothetical protein
MFTQQHQTTSCDSTILPLCELFGSPCQCAVESDCLSICVPAAVCVDLCPAVLPDPHSSKQQQGPVPHTVQVRAGCMPEALITADVVPAALPAHCLHQHHQQVPAVVGLVASGVLVMSLTVGAHTRTCLCFMYTSVLFNTRVHPAVKQCPTSFVQ